MRVQASILKLQYSGNRAEAQSVADDHREHEARGNAELKPKIDRIGFAGQ